MKRLTIVKTGSTIPPLRDRRGDFEAWFCDGLGLNEQQVDVVDAQRGAPLPDPAATCGVVVTGSPAMATDEEPWSVAIERWLAATLAARVPVLGVCYGHQLLARAAGGEVDYNPKGREIGTHDVALTDAGRDDPLFDGLPAQLSVQVTHCQSVTRLPPGARLLAHNPHDQHQAFAIGERAWGVQFHPEFDADITRGYIAHRREDIAGEGLDPDALAQGAFDSDHGAAVLRNFARIVRG